MLITNNQDIYERAVLLGHFNVRAIQSVQLEPLKKFAETGYGLNYRMHPLGGAMALVQFSKLDERIQLGNERLSYLSKRLTDLPGIRTPITRAHVTRGAFYGYKIRYTSSELSNLPMNVFVKALQAEGVSIKGTGYKPLHLTALFSGTSDGLDNFSFSVPSTRKAYNEGDLPISEKVYSVSLSLPTFTYEPYSIIDEYVSAFEKVINNVEKLI